jgi:hypothetical protein
MKLSLAGQKFRQPRGQMILCHFKRRDIACAVVRQNVQGERGKDKRRGFPAQHQSSAAPPSVGTLAQAYSNEEPVHQHKRNACDKREGPLNH